GCSRRSSGTDPGTGRPGTAWADTAGSCSTRSRRARSTKQIRETRSSPPTAEHLDLVLPPAQQVVGLQGDLSKRWALHMRNRIDHVQHDLLDDIPAGYLLQTGIKLAGVQLAAERPAGAVGSTDDRVQVRVHRFGGLALDSCPVRRPPGAEAGA